MAPSPRYPKTIHYRGDGVFMVRSPTRPPSSRGFCTMLTRRLRVVRGKLPLSLGMSPRLRLRPGQPSTSDSAITSPPDETGRLALLASISTGSAALKSLWQLNCTPAAFR